MKSEEGQKQRPGESAPLLLKQSTSTFRLDGDTRTIKVGHTGMDHTKRHADRSRGSDWTWLTLGGLTNFSNSSKTRRRRSKHNATLLVMASYIVVIIYTLTIFLGPLHLVLREKSEWCPFDADDSSNNERNLKASGDYSAPLAEGEYENPDYNTDPCLYLRLPQLVWLTLEECDMSRRMVASVVLGGAIGYERRSSDRPAGIRTMGLVSLGACFFTISSIMAFKSSTMAWDSSRVTAALPSGVGFLGAALIWKGTLGVGVNETHQVHGLTTAASLWLSAAIGVGTGGALYVVSIYSTVLILLVLRFGPKLYSQDDEEDESPNDEYVSEDDEVQKEFLQPLDPQEPEPDAEKTVMFESDHLTPDPETPSRNSFYSPRSHSDRFPSERSHSERSQSERSASWRRRLSHHSSRPTFHD